VIIGAPGIEPCVNMIVMRKIADELTFATLVEDLTAQIRRIMTSRPDEPWALVGIRSRGDILAQRVAAKLDGALGDHPVGVVDITLYRDDLSEIGPAARVQTTEISFPVDGTNIILIDDVLMTGRSIRAALQSIMDLGRPRRVWLAVLVDRGGRELPICCDAVGWRLDPKTHPLKQDELVVVRIRPEHDEDAVYVQARGEKGTVS